MENGTWIEYQKMVLRLLDEHDTQLNQFVERIIKIEGAVTRIDSTLLSAQKTLEALEATCVKLNKIEEELGNKVALLETHQSKDDKKVEEDQKSRFLLWVAAFGTGLTIAWELVKKYFGF